MKVFGTFFCRCLLPAALLASAGCATTTSTSSKTNDGTDWSQAARQWDDLSPIEKAETVLWEPFQYALLFGGSALGGR